MLFCKEVALTHVRRNHWMVSIKSQDVQGETVKMPIAFSTTVLRTQRASQRSLTESAVVWRKVLSHSNFRVMFQK